MVLISNLFKFKNKNIFFNLLTVFGLGPRLGSFLVKSCGLQTFVFFNDLKPTLVSKLSRFFFFLSLCLNDSLKQNQIDIFSKKLKIKHYKALRFVAKLPVRGQRTKTNAKTSKKRKIY